MIIIWIIIFFVFIRYFILPQVSLFFFSTHLLKWQQRDSNHSHLVRKPTLNHLVKLAFKWFSCVVSTYLCGVFDCMLNSWVSVYELSVCGFESRCCHLKFHVNSFTFTISVFFGTRKLLDRSNINAEELTGVLQLSLHLPKLITNK